MKYAKVALVVAIFAGLCSAVKANLIVVGDPEEGASWVQRFEESGVGQFDLVAVMMSSAGDSFETPTFSKFQLTSGYTATWSLLYEAIPPYPLLASASGPATTWLRFNIRFAGSKSDPLTFDYVAFNGLNIVNTAHIVWTGSGWSITNYGTKSPYWNPTRGQVVPAPAAVVLAAGGLGLAGWIRRRRIA